MNTLLDKPGKALKHETLAKYDELKASLAEQAYPHEVKSVLQDVIKVGRHEACSLNVLGKMLNTSGTTIMRLMKGSYEADETTMVSRIGEAIKLWHSRNQGVPIPEFVSTAQARNIFAAADEARSEQEIIQIIGMTQIGKTWACKHYAKTHDRTIYTYICRPATIGNIARNLAEACGVSSAGRLDTVTRRIREALTPNHLVIVDEMQQLLIMDSNAGASALEWLRLEIFDQVGCGMLMVADNAWGDAFASSKMSGSMQRTKKRGGALHLPNVPTNQDVQAFCKHYAMPEQITAEAADIIKKSVRRDGMRALNKLFRKATRISARGKEITNWNHFVIAYETGKALRGDF